METLQHTFFEDPAVVYVILGVALLVLGGLWWTRRQKKLLLLMIAPPLLALAVFAVERLVVTDREQIKLNTEDVARKIESGDVRGACIYLDDQFGGRWFTREVAVSAGEEFLRANPVRKISFTGLDIQKPTNFASMNVCTIIEFAGGEASGQKASLIWTVHWVKKSGRWLIDDVDFKQGVKL